MTEHRWRYAMHERVQLRPYVTQGIRPECVPPLEWIVTALHCTVTEDARVIERYTITPVRTKERAMVVNTDQMAPFPATEV